MKPSGKRQPNKRHVSCVKRDVGPTSSAIRCWVPWAMLVMRIVDPTSAELVYDGPGEPVWTACGKMQKNGQRNISLAKLRSLT
jgi:hypothetical protein